MKKLLTTLLCAGLALTAGARELVVTLQSGERMAFHLSSTEEVLMTQTESEVTLAGVTLPRTDIREMRIFQQLPEDAIPVGIIGVENGQWRMDNGQWTMDNGQGAGDEGVYDLSGRRVAGSALELMRQEARPRAGVYLIKKRKVVIR